jgi:hypothetical protein
MSRGVTLKGDAAKAFVEGMFGKKPKTDDDAYMRIATYVHMEMSRKGKESIQGHLKARLIIKCLSKEGIDKCLDIIEGRT